MAMSKFRNRGSGMTLLAGLIMFLISLVFFIPYFNKYEHKSMIALFVAMILSGLCYLMAFYLNKKGYFRPGWLLSQSFIQISLGIFLLILKFSDNDSINTYNLILGLWALFTSSTQFSTSIQIRALEVKLWYWLTIISLSNIIIACLYLFAPFGDSILAFNLLTGLFLLDFSFSSNIEYIFYKG